MNDNIRFRAKDCSRVYTPVQRGEVCWFASLMMTMFFSQYMRGVSSAHAKKIASKKDWKSDIAKAMLLIMKNYEIDSLDSNVGKLEPRAFLKALRKYDSSYFNDGPSEDLSAHYAPYQHKLLAFLEIPHLSLVVKRGYLNATYSAYNFDLPLDDYKWEDAVKTMNPVGSFIDIEDPEVILIHREAGESHLHSSWKYPKPDVHDVGGLNLVRHPNTITYNSNKYVLDSCILPSYVTTKACTMGHAVAGITCNDKRFVYNGWAVDSGDSSMAGARKVTRSVPCALMPSDWAADKSLCINTDACSMNEVNAKKKGREFCFEAFKRSTVVYVREDFAKNAGYIPKIILKIPPKENTPRKIALKPAPLPKPAPVPKPLPKAAPVTIDANKKAKLNEMKKRIQARK
ncbi:hypothetical protein ATCVCan0610SP_782L [Acanthocystis turfacea Chlorella virus Can0610SP]|nr:hypothetical protein ATCVCan0610SP_782L [Acanthocystis turfacea Chlorella virus Can0610SP]